MWRMSYPPRRPAPPPARWVAEVAPALAGLGLLVVIGLSLTGESRWRRRGSRRLADLRRPALRPGRDLPAAPHAPSHRPHPAAWSGRVGQDRLVRWHRQLGPWPIVLLTLHALLITAGYARGRPHRRPARALAPAHHLSRRAGGRRGPGAADHGRRRVVSVGPAPAALRDLVVRPPLHLPGRGAGLRPSAGQRGVVRGPSPRPGGLGRAVGRPRPAPSWSAASACPVWRTAAPSAAGRGGPRGRPRRGVGDLLRSPPGAPGGVGRPVLPVALPGTGAVVAGPSVFAVGPAAARRTCGSRSRGSATSPTPWPGYRQGPGSPSKGRTACSPTTPAGGAASCWWPPAWASPPIRALLEDLPDGVDVAVILRGSRPGDLVLRDEVAAMVRGRPGRRACTRSSAPATRCGWIRTPCAAWSPMSATGTSTCAAPRAFGDGVVAAARRLAVPEDRIHLEEFAF